MNTAILQLALFAAEKLLVHAPTLFAGFQTLIAKKNVTVEELKAERDRIAAQSYKELVPNSKLPADELGQ